MKCSAVGCVNQEGEGTFKDGYCLPCWLFVNQNIDNENRTEAAWASEPTDALLPMFQDEEHWSLETSLVLLRSW